MSYEINKEQLIKRLLIATKSKNDSDLANKCGYQRSMVSNWRRGYGINFEMLLEVFGDEVDWNYIMTGKEGGAVMVQMRKIEAEIQNLAKTLQKEEEK